MSRLPRLTAGSFVLVALLLAASAGCRGPSFGKVSGEVKFKGQALPSGTISFVSPLRGVRPADGLIKNGRYSIDKVPTGEVTILIIGPPKPPPDPKAKPRKPKDKKKEDEGFPTKYSDLNQSGLKMTVTTGEQTKNLDLQP